MSEELKQFLSFFGISEEVDSKNLLLIINGNVQNPRKVIKNFNILIFKHRIIGKSQDLPDKIPDDVKVIDAADKIITPGLIDQHIHGGYGCDFNVSSVDEIVDFAAKMPKHGITSIVPTVMTATKDILKAQIEKISEAKNKKSGNSVKFLGIHLEGPFLSPKYRGIHPEDEIIKPSVDDFRQIEHKDVRIVAFAPELDKDLKLTEYLVGKNIIPSAGHTEADFELINKASKVGLKQITHLFNAMAPLHHRTPGVIGAALTNDDLCVEVIADGMHLHPAIIDMIFRAKPDSKVILISDSLPLNSAEQDSLIFGNQKIFRKEGKAVNVDGTFAGSLVFLDTVLNNLIKWKLADLSGVLKFASLNVAQNLGLADFGFIDIGKIADIVIWEKDDNNTYIVDTTIINGQIAYSANK